MSKKINPRSHYTYRCKYCGHECIKEAGLASGLGITKQGNYGNAGTPAPTTFNDEVYTAITLSFVAETSDEPAKIVDAVAKFGEKHFHCGMAINVSTGSGTNDGDYTIASRGGVTNDVLSLSSSDSLTTESAATAGEVTINQINYEPNVTRGCPFCGSLNSR